MSEEGGRRSRRSRGEPEEPLRPGEVRFSTALGLLFRVVSVTGEAAEVEHVPSGWRWVSDAPGTLQKAPRVAEGGFRWRAAHQRVGAFAGVDPDEVASWLLLDEQARGGTRLRARSIGEATAGIPGGAALADRVLDHLEGSDHWVREGVGTERGFVRSSGRRDWRERWSEAELPRPTGEEALNEDAARAGLQRLCGAADPDLQTLGRIATTRWLPQELRHDALSRLVDAWRRSRRRSAFRHVKEEALIAMLKLEPKLDVDFAIEPAVTLAVREAAVERLTQRGTPFASLIRAVKAPSDLRVASQLAVLATTTEDLAGCLGLCMAATAGEEARRDAMDLLVARLESEDRVEVLLTAASRALTAGSRPQQTREWLQVLGGDSAVGDIAEALGTVQRLRGRDNLLTTLAISTQELEAGVTRWLEEELSLSERWEPPATVPDPGERDFVDKFLRHIEGARLSRRIDWLVRTAEALSGHVQQLHIENTRLSDLVESEDNAGRVLRGRDTERIRASREALLAGVRAEVAAERATERLALAAALADVQTAVGRTRLSGPNVALENLERRITQVAQRFQLEFIGRVGDRVATNLDVYTLAAGVGERGLVLSVGVQSASAVLVKGKLGPMEG